MKKGKPQLSLAPARRRSLKWGPWRRCRNNNNNNNNNDNNNNSSSKNSSNNSDNNSNNNSSNNNSSNNSSNTSINNSNNNSSNNNDILVIIIVIIIITSLITESSFDPFSLAWKRVAKLQRSLLSTRARLLEGGTVQWRASFGKAKTTQAAAEGSQTMLGII